MSILKNKSAAKREPAYTHRVVYTAPSGDGFAMAATQRQALRAFNECVAKGYIDPHNGRRIAVLTEAEYARIAGAR